MAASKMAAAALLLLPSVGAIDNGLGRTPPMGWRSWNLYGNDVSQSLLQSVMDGMVSKKRAVDGVATSLCDLGYCDVGLDDAWQQCGAGADGYHYHDHDGKPIVNTTRFPDLKAMTDYAHKLGLTAGWYGNNCDCSESKAATQAMYEQDVHFLTNVFQFDAVKLDGCGTEYDLDNWAHLINQSGRPIVIENCHWGQTVPTETWCPWNFFRTSGDIRASYGSMVGNLQTTVQFAQKNLSRPGCWAYPDMLEVGCQHGPGGAGDPGMNLAETRSHFGAWCIVSSPLTLSHDVNNDTVMDAIWPIISNKEAIAVNQAWAGHSGSPFKMSEERVALADYNHVIRGTVVPHEGDAPKWQYFFKPVGAGKVAVLLMNHDSAEQRLHLSFADVPSLQGAAFAVRDIWERKDMGIATGGLDCTVPSHDSVFLLLDPHAAPPALVLAV